MIEKTGSIPLEIVAAAETEKPFDWPGFFKRPDNWSKAKGFFDRLSVEEQAVIDSLALSGQCWQGDLWDSLESALEKPLTERSFELWYGKLQDHRLVSATPVKRPVRGVPVDDILFASFYR